MTESVPALEVESLYVRYGPVEAVRGASFRVYERQTLALLGANGAGKSSLISAVMGLVRSRGSVKFYGRECSGWRPDEAVSAGCVVVPEGRGIIGNLSVEQNLSLGGYWRQRSAKSDVIERVWSMFPVLYERRNQRAGMLSGGEQQMLAIGRGLLAEPKVFILDEPTMGLAPKLVDEVLVALQVIQQEGMAMLIVEQNARSALRISHSAAVLAQGRIVATGSAQAIGSNEDLFRLYIA